MATTDEQQSGVRTVAGAMLNLGSRSQRGQYPAPVESDAVAVDWSGFRQD
jgi:hypothetical protein